MQIRRTLVLLVLTLAMVAATSVAVEAKYMFQAYGHDVVRYTYKDISPSYRPYISYIDYDVTSVPYNGVRFHFTPKGKTAIARSLGLAESMARNVIAAPEWTGDRSLKSVKWEIYQHAVWPDKMVVDIEYHYRDLQSWEVPYKFY